MAHALTRFELVASAQKWDERKQLKIVPTLLNEKLLDSNMEWAEEEKSSLQALKKSLMDKCDLVKDLLIAGKQFTA